LAQRNPLDVWRSERSIGSADSGAAARENGRWSSGFSRLVCQFDWRESFTGEIGTTSAARDDLAAIALLEYG
jgi:hypothetical protein